MKVEEIQTIEDLLAYTLEYEDCIYFREKVNDEWDSIALKDLSPRRKAQRILELLEDGRIPVRVKRDEELSDRA